MPGPPLRNTMKHHRSEHVPSECHFRFSWRISSNAPVVYACWMDRVKFQDLVEQAIGELPEDFRTRLENVVVIVEDRPSRELLDGIEIPPGEVLFGLYEGTPLTERGFGTPLYPDRISIFQRPIEEECESEEEIREEIKTTIVHEVAHFFGLDDDYLERMGY